MAYKLGSKVICRLGLKEEVGEVFGYSSMPYNPIPYEYFIRFQESSKRPYITIHASLVRLQDIPTIHSAIHKGKLHITDQTICPISHEEFIDGQEVVQLMNKYIFDSEQLGIFWTIKGNSINPITNLEIVRQSDIIRFTVVLSDSL
jgi:hypothetical protein